MIDNQYNKMYLCVYTTKIKNICVQQNNAKYATYTATHAQTTTHIITLLYFVSLSKPYAECTTQKIQ